ncbi:hypothetical protein [Shinella zoogloeoides]|nr:hypothetical protein [Shinella zoogloeoides]UEX81900.1 hypothetical protein K8M09_00930 [Shinella zoogloeoides]
MNSKEYNNSIIDWISGIIKEKYVLRKSEYETFEAFLTLNAYFITFEFDQNTINQKYVQSEDRAPIGSIEMKQFSNIYNMMCRENFGRNYNKIPDEAKPLAVACIDANGSRYWRELGDVENVHIHSIWIMDVDGVAP